MFNMPDKALISQINMLMISEFDGAIISKRTDYAAYDEAWALVDARANVPSNFFFHKECIDNKGE
ncbi:hypothetical protein PN836_006370 [Ningiella sp. W23]|uniref:hypothetical protein n=1 Tax=Ningiella sp. W23 TaxID=3023715 RepID=UPI0037581B17